MAKLNPNVTTDVIEGSPTMSVGSSGFQHTRVFIVKNLTGPEHSRHYLAYGQVGIQRGDAHPGPGDLQFLPASNCTVEMMASDNTIAKVTWVYAIESESSSPVGGVGKLEVGSTVQQIQTNKDADGNIITVSYLAPETPENPQPTFDTQSGTLNVQAPLVTYTITRREAPSQTLGIPIGEVSKQYDRTVNSITWENGAPGTWLCHGITAETDAGGNALTVRYSFIYNPDTWRARVVYVGADGKVPADISDPRHQGLADRLVDIYQSKDFNALNLVYV